MLSFLDLVIQYKFIVFPKWWDAAWSKQNHKTIQPFVDHRSISGRKPPTRRSGHVGTGSFGGCQQVFCGTDLQIEVADNKNNQKRTKTTYWLAYNLFISMWKVRTKWVGVDWFELNEELMMHFQCDTVLSQPEEISMSLVYNSLVIVRLYGVWFIVLPFYDPLCVCNVKFADDFCVFFQHAFSICLGIFLNEQTYAGMQVPDPPGWTRPSLT